MRQPLLALPDAGGVGRRPAFRCPELERLGMAVIRWFLVSTVRGRCRRSLDRVQVPRRYASVELVIGRIRRYVPVRRVINC